MIQDGHHQHLEHLVEPIRGRGESRAFYLCIDERQMSKTRRMGLGSAKGAMKGKSSLRHFHSVHGCHGLVP
jgi:hypothetical protein